MAEMELQTLDLRIALAYTGLENPPLEGVPLAGKTMVPDGSGSFIQAGLGEEMTEGEEELFLFDEEELIAFDPDEGPRLCRPLPRPSFYGRLSSSDPPEAEGTARALPAGTYVFSQWRPRDKKELLDGIEWFAREAWWERAATKGPYILRRLREDGRLATQILRSGCRGIR